MKQITLLIASFLLISLCASVAGATTITGQGSATMQLPRLLTPTQSIFPKLNFSKAATIKAPVIVTAESVPFGTRAWTNDPETEPAPPPPPTGYQGSPAQPAPMAPANAPYEESNILLYTVVTVAVVVGVLVLLVLISGEDDTYDDGYKKKSLAAPRAPLLNFSF